MSDHIRVNAKYEERLRVKHLAMEPPLQGAAVRFTFEAHEMEIRLPMLPPEEKRKLYSEYAEAEADVWNKSGEILQIHIYAVSVAVLGLEFEIPAAAADHAHMDASLYDETKTRELDERSDQLYFLARRAIDYWLRVVRWKTGLGLIDIDTRAGRATLFGGRLFNNAHGGAFYSPRVGRTLVVPKRHCLKPTTWQEIAAAVAAGITPPLWNEYLMSAHQRIDIGDLRAATIDLAIAAESAMRRAVDGRLPTTTSMPERNKIARVPLKRLIARWDEFGLPAISQLQWFGALKTLIDVRNRLMHNSDDQRVQTSFCRETSDAVEKLIAALAI